MALGTQTQSESSGLILEWMESEGMAADLGEPLYQQALWLMAWGQMDAARKLLAEPGPITAEDLKARKPLG